MNVSKKITSNTDFKNEQESNINVGDIDNDNKDYNCETAGTQDDDYDMEDVYANANNVLVPTDNNESNRKLEPINETNDDPCIVNNEICNDNTINDDDVQEVPVQDVDIIIINDDDDVDKVSVEDVSIIDSDNDVEVSVKSTKKCNGRFEGLHQCMDTTALLNQFAENHDEASVIDDIDESNNSDKQKKAFSSYDIKEGRIASINNSINSCISGNGVDSSTDGNSNVNDNSIRSNNNTCSVSSTNGNSSFNNKNGNQGIYACDMDKDNNDRDDNMVLNDDSGNSPPDIIYNIDDDDSDFDGDDCKIVNVIPATNNNQQLKVQYPIMGNQKWNCPIVIDGHSVAVLYDLKKKKSSFEFDRLLKCLRYFWEITNGTVVALISKKYLAIAHAQSSAEVQKEISSKKAIKLIPNRCTDGKTFEIFDNSVFLECTHLLNGLLVTNKHFKVSIQSSRPYRRIIKNRLVGFQFFGEDLQVYGRGTKTLCELMSKTYT